MSNPFQRPGRMKPAAMNHMSDSMARAQKAFFKEAAEVLNRYGHEDAAFYFEQVDDHLSRGGSLSDNPARILGV